MPIYLPDGSLAGGFNGTLTSNLICNGYKVYIYKASTDAASIYLARNSSTGNLIIHVPSGKAIEYTVG